MTLNADMDDFLFLSISWKKIGSDGVGGVAEWLRALMIYQRTGVPSDPSTHIR